LLLRSVVSSIDRLSGVFLQFLANQQPPPPLQQPPQQTAHGI
jgi:hypothetical protein